MFQVKDCKKYLFPWVKSLLFKAKTLNFVEVLSGFKRDHVVSADTVDGTGSRVLCLKIMDGVTFGSLISRNASLLSTVRLGKMAQHAPLWALLMAKLKGQSQNAIRLYA